MRFLERENNFFLVKAFSTHTQVQYEDAATPLVA